MRSWNSDAKDIDFKGLMYENIKEYVVTNYEIDSFLRYPDSEKRYIIAPKGVGKTHLLLMKSVLMRKKGGLKVYPEFDKVANLGAINIRITKKVASRFKNIDQWEELWRLVLLTWIHTQMNLDLPKELEEIVKESDELEGIAELFIKNYQTVDPLFPLVNSYLLPRIRKNKEVNQFACFIDNLDEAFSSNLGNSNWSAEAIDRVTKFWSLAQIGLLNASRNLARRVPHMDIFLTIRLEAFNTLQHEQKLQTESNCLFLNYDYNFLKSIVDNRISQIDPSRLRLPNASESLERLTGIKSIPHSIVRNSSGDPLREKTFNYVLRHTFGRPREIINILKSFLPGETRELPIKNIRAKVNKHSLAIFKQLTNEIVPYFDMELFKLFCKLIPSNVITLDIAKEVSDNVEQQYGQPNVFSYLYGFGIIGVIEKNTRGQFIQKFNDPGTYTLNDIEIPHVSHFVLHPSTYSFISMQIKDVKLDRFLDPVNIIGNTREFNANHQKRSSILHVHFGMDDDSTSIIIPETAKSKPVVIISRIEPQFERIHQSEKLILNLEVNGESEKYEFDILTDESVLEDFNDIYGQWQNRRNFFICTNNKNVVRKIINKADTISFSKFYSHYFKYFDEIFNVTTISRIYFVDRYIRKVTKKAIVKKFGEEQKYKNISIDFALAERIFFKHSFDSIDRPLGNYVYNIVTTSGSFVIPNHDQRTLKSTGIVRRTDRESEFKFYNLRNSYLHEGVYQFYKLLKRKFPNKNSFSKEVDFFIDMQIWRLINNVSSNTIRSIFNKSSIESCAEELKDYSKNILENYRSVRQRWNHKTDKLKKYVGDGVLPTYRIYYDYVWNAEKCDYQTSNTVREILGVELMKRGARKKKRIFISYSTYDTKNAYKLYFAFHSYGYETFMFPEDDKQDNVRKRISDAINNRSVFLFLSSMNSLTSIPCQNEITVFRDKILYSEDYKLICLDLDKALDSPMEIEFPDVGSSLIGKFKDNVNFLRRNTIYKYIGASIRSTGSPKFKKFFDSFITSNLE